MALNYEQDLQINKHALDAELLDQAQRMFRYSSAHAQAMLNRDKAKQSLDITKANLDASIRAELTTAGTKFTEAVVDGRIRTAPTYMEDQRKFMQAEHEVQLLLGAVMAMNARRSMLENLVKLFLGQYWSEPRLEGRGMAPDIAQDATERAIMQGPPPISIPQTSPSPKPMGNELKKKILENGPMGIFIGTDPPTEVDGQPLVWDKGANSFVIDCPESPHHGMKLQDYLVVSLQWRKAKKELAAASPPAPGIPKPPPPMRPVPRAK